MFEFTSNSTYREISCYAHCMEIKKYVPTITAEQLERIYNFLMRDPNNKIFITPEMLSFIKENDETECADTIDNLNINLPFARIEVGSVVFNVVRNIETTSSSGCSGCGGCSSNNNNNNNNNNNG